MSDPDVNKAAALALLKQGLVSQAEAARLAGRSRQIVAHWVSDLFNQHRIDVIDQREAYLKKQWAAAVKAAKED